MKPEAIRVLPVSIPRMPTSEDNTLLEDSKIMKYSRLRLIVSAGLLSSLFLLDSNIAKSQQASPVVTVTPNQVSFPNVPSGGTATQTLTVSVSSSSAVAVNTAGLPSWVQVTPSGSINVTTGSPATLTVTANPPAGLPPGSYDSAFSVGIQGSSPQAVLVTTLVTGKSVLSASPSSLTFAALP